MKVRIYRTMVDFRAGGIRGQMDGAFPIVPRPDRTGTKTSAAIWADILQNRFSARAAERAFERADHRFQ